MNLGNKCIQIDLAAFIDKHQYLSYTLEEMLFSWAYIYFVCYFSKLKQQMLYVQNVSLYYFTLCKNYMYSNQSFPYCISRKQSSRNSTTSAPTRTTARRTETGTECMSQFFCTNINKTALCLT